MPFTPGEVLAFCWFWHAVFLTILTIAFARGSAERSGSLFQWPVRGRWIITLFIGATAAMMIGVAFDAIRFQILQPPLREMAWWGVAIRALPCPLGPWAVIRNHRRGLLDD